jgi:hypothetical protein
MPSCDPPTLYAPGKPLRQDAAAWRSCGAGKPLVRRHAMNALKQAVRDLVQDESGKASKSVSSPPCTGKDLKQYMSSVNEFFAAELLRMRRIITMALRLVWRWNFHLIFEHAFNGRDHRLIVDHGNMNGRRLGMRLLRSGRPCGSYCWAPMRSPSSLCGRCSTGPL